ncbi:phage tail tape measure protein [Pseudomonas endophytica]|uniref:phage tail tape measure protein n=1 Tax=Pseudomonas endophytica TaxID=1563157 RepID=UPI000AF42052|nr:phage tail tape measure protein [Pseudomonas endophytica]
MDIASLGIKVDSSDAANAVTDLDKLSQSGERAEKAAEGVASGFDRTADAARKQRQDLDSLLGKVDPLTKKLNELAAQEDKLAEARKAGLIGDAAYSNYQQKIEASLNSLLGLSGAQKVVGDSAADSASRIQELAQATVLAAESQRELSSVATGLSEAQQGLLTGSRALVGSYADSALGADRSAEAVERVAAASKRSGESAASEMAILGQLERAISSAAGSRENLSKANELYVKAQERGLLTVEEEIRLDTELEKAELKVEAARLKRTAAEQKEEQQKQRSIEAENRRIEALKRTVNGIDPLTQKLGKLEAREKALNDLYKTGEIDANGYAEALAKIGRDRAGLTEATGAFDKLNLSTKQSQQNVMQLINAVRTGDWTSGIRAVTQLGGGSVLGGIKEKFDTLFTGGAGAAVLGESLGDIAAKSKDVAEKAGEAGESISDLAEKSNTAAESTGNAKKGLEALSLSTGPVGLGMAALAVGVVAAAAAVGVLAYGYYQGSKEADAYNKSLILTGNYAGSSAGQLADLARQVSATNGTTGEAAATLAKLAGSSAIASSSFKEIADAAAAMEDATGRSVDATIAEFVKIAKDPVSAAKELNDQYHFLTASVYSQIVALKEQGNTTAATDLLTKTYAETVQDRSRQITENLGTIERAWKGIKDAAAGALDATLNIGRALTLEQQAQTLRDRIANNQGRGGRAAALGLDTRNKEKDKADLAFLELQIDAEKTKNKYLGDRRKIQDDAIDAQTKVDALTKSAWTNEQKRTEALKEYKKQLDDIRKANPDDARLNKGVVDKNIANINAKFKDPKAASAGAVDLTEFNTSQNAIKTILAEYANAQKELDALQKAGLISQEEFGWKRAGMIGNQKDEITAAYEAEIAALESAKARKTTSAVQSIELDKKIANARTDMVKAQKDADSQLEVLRVSEEGRINKQTQAVKSYTDALNQQNHALQLAGQRAALGIRQGDRQNALNGELNGIADRANQQRLDLARDKSDAARNMSADEYNHKLAAINKSESDLKETTLSNYEDMSAAQSDWRNGATSAFQNYLDSARDVAGQTKSLFGNAFSSMEDSVVNFAITGKASFADFTKSILADMARIAARQAASGILSSMGGLGVSAVGSYFGGGAASAGSTQAGYSPEVIGGWSGIAQANGGAWESGVQMFADGGAFTNSIVSKPTAFGMANGQIGVMGEDGEEAIMPLTRTAGGKLGVRAVGGAAGGGTTVSLSMPIMVMTDEESGRPAGAELDTEVFQRNMQERMRTVAREEISKSWRQGGISSRNVKG